MQMSFFGRGARILFRYVWPATTWGIHNLSIFGILAVGIWLEQLPLEKVFAAIFPLEMLAVVPAPIEHQGILTAVSGS